MQEPSKHVPGYARPQDSYSCGHEQGCRRGPTATGNCCAEDECRPVQIDGRWVCRRSMARGGVCECGPGPNGECGMPARGCQPRASLRIKRSRVALLSVGVLLAIVSVLLGSSYNGAFLAPGPLCTAHANVLKDETGLDRCARCHALGDRGAGTWIAAIFSRDAIGSVNSEKCLACHDATLPRMAARNPHNLPQTQLEALTANHQGRESGSDRSLLGRMATTLVSGTMSEVECATCHREHQSAAELSSLTDQQCQVCHVQTFHSFEVDHPEFTSFPTRFDRHVSYDHRSHEEKHFREKGVAYSCGLCHVEDPTRQAMRLKPFEQACGQCHEQTIQVASMSGLELLRLPAIDSNLLRQAGFEPGDWPQEISTGFDGELSPATLALLHGDDRVRRAIAKLGGSVDFTLLDDSDTEQLQAANEIVWGLKRLIWELSTRDSAAIEKRLELAGAGDRVAIRQWVAMLPSTQLEELAAVWLPDLEFELKQIETLREDWSASVPSENRGSLAIVSGSNVDLGGHEAAAVPELQATLEATGATWSSSLDAFAAAWLEQERLAENPLASLRQDQVANGPAAAEVRETEVAEPAIASNEAGPESVSEIASGAGQPAETTTGSALPGPASPDASRVDSPAAPVGPNSTVPRVAPAANASGELLAANPLRELLGASSMGSSASVAPVLPDAAEPGEQGSGTATAPSQQETPGEQIVEVEQERTIELDAEEREHEEAMSLAIDREDGQILPWRFTPELKVGWVRNDSTWTLVYYPQGHADGVMAGLIEVIAGASWELESSDLASARATPLLAEERGVGQVVSWRAASMGLSEDAGVAALAQALSSPSATGACTKCHVLPGSDETRPMQWRGYRREVNRSQFTRFSHGAHLTQLELRDCRTCHELKEPEATAVSHRSTSEFRGMTRVECASCHRSGRAANQCTTCHAYHVDIPTLGHGMSEPRRVE